MRRNFWVKSASMLDDYRTGKDLEVCVAMGMGLAVVTGDVLVINYLGGKPKTSLERRVVAVRQYPNFAKMLEQESSARICPGLTAKQVLDKLCCRYSQNSRVRGILVFELVPLCKRV